MPGEEGLVRPFLKWAGGKRQLVDNLRRSMPRGFVFDTYYEPFIGAGAFLFEIQPSKAVINDLNSELISTYRSIKNRPEELLVALKNYENCNNAEDFYRIRGLDRDRTAYEKMSDVQKAARMIYLNRTCFNGLYRVNSKGLFNTPFGRYKSPTICNEPVIRAVHNYFSGDGHDITILNGDFEDCVRTATEDDFVYFDPPYYSPDNSDFTSYQSKGFDAEQQTRLRDIFKRLSDKGVRCMLSNSSVEFIWDLYSEFHVQKEIKATRAINCKSDGRGYVDEVIVTNYDVPLSPTQFKLLGN